MILRTRQGFEYEVEQEPNSGMMIITREIYEDVHARNPYASPILPPITEAELAQINARAEALIAQERTKKAKKLARKFLNTYAPAIIPDGSGRTALIVAVDAWKMREENARKKSNTREGVAGMFLFRNTADNSNLHASTVSAPSLEAMEGMDITKIIEEKFDMPAGSVTLVNINDVTEGQRHAVLDCIKYLETPNATGFGAVGAA
jgi:hypothetical protein